VLRPVVREYRAHIAATNGQCGGFLRTGIAPQLRPADRVPYLGDLDRSGGQIEDNTRRVLEREIGGALRWERLALTHEEVTAYDLPVITKHDRRYKDGKPHEAVETEAISQRVLIELVRARLDKLLPEPLRAFMNARCANAARSRPHFSPNAGARRRINQFCRHEAKGDVVATRRKGDDHEA
jgi:hypothetical protein